MLELLEALNHDLFGLLDGQGRLRPRALRRAFLILSGLLVLALLLFSLGGRRFLPQWADTAIAVLFVGCLVLLAVGTLVLLVQLAFIGGIELLARLRKHTDR